MPECYLDTNLVEVLLGCLDAVNHKKGNSSVMATLGQDKFRENFAVALIDDDKVEVKALEDFIKVDRLCREGLMFYRHNEKKHYVLKLSPAIELWLLNECSKGEIDTNLYGLPQNLKGLRSMKGLSQRKDERFKKLFKDMLKNERCDEITELKRWLIFLKDKNFNIDLDLL
ncbi:MAG: hypothetical protein H7Y86_15640 [Rhizobacter sp.]|nr:hypothetical protein [Ferruginibacter sp.]